VGSNGDSKLHAVGRTGQFRIRLPDLLRAPKGVPGRRKAISLGVVCVVYRHANFGDLRHSDAALTVAKQTKPGSRDKRYCNDDHWNDSAVLADWEGLGLCPLAASVFGFRGGRDGLLLGAGGIP